MYILFPLASYLGGSSTLTNCTSCILISKGRSHGRILCTEQKVSQFKLCTIDLGIAGAHCLGIFRYFWHAEIAGHRSTVSVMASAYDT